MRRADQFYNWCLRLLLERVCDWCVEHQHRENLARAPLRIIFARRGGHDYDHLFAYLDRLKMQIQSGTLFLKGKRLEPIFLARSMWSIERAEALAGLQLADTVASAFYQGANSASPTHDTEPAKALGPIIAQDANGNRANVGLTVWPLPHQAPIPDDAKAIFRHYGYGF